MSRTIPPDLLTYLRGHATEACLLTKVGPLLDGSYRYFADLDQDLAYDDGDGEQTYIARTGMQVSAFVSAADLGVDNAEMDTLPPVAGYEVEGFTAAQLKSGELDGIAYVTYCVAYRNLALGHFIWSGGNIGEARIRGAALINLEQRSLSNKLKQLIGDVDSTTCRAIHGSMPIGTGGGVVEEMFPCEYDISGDWVSFTVTDTHPTDSDLIFYTTDLVAADNFFAPGMVRWTSGANVGAYIEVEGYSTDAGEATVTCQHGLPRAVQVGDVGEVRPRCTKHWVGHNSCETFHGVEKTLHFRGEPHQPVGDAGLALIGGTGIPGDVGGTGEFPTTDPVIPTPPSGGAGTPGTPTARSIGGDTEDACAHGADPSASAATNVTAINAAIAALAGGGGEVYFSVPGAYSVTPGNTSGLIVLDRNNTRLNFEGVTLHAAHSTTTTAPSTHRDVIRVDGATEWEIVDVTIVGYLDTWVSGGGAGAYGISEWAHGIFVTDSSSAGSINNATISKCVGDGISLGYTASDIYIDNPRITNCRRQGISTGADNIVIDGFDISYIGTTAPPANGPWAGIDVEVDSPETSSGTVIRNGRTHHNKGPGVLAVVRTSSITIQNVTSDYNQNYGILLSNSDTGSIKGCTLEHNKYHGVKLQTDSDGWTIGGATADSADKNAFFNNYTSLNGTITSGSPTTLSGESSATEEHLSVSSDSAVSVLYNTYGPA